MAKFIIEGQNVLNGEIEVLGSKNCSLKIFASALLFKKPLNIKNVPLIEDIFKMAKLLEGLGVKVEQNNRNFLISGQKISSFELDKHIASRLRASIVLLSPLLGRLKQAILPYPGGCIIGKRPIDIFLDAFKKMGVNIYERGNHFYFKTPCLKGAKIFFHYPSVTATETLILAAIAAKGTTIIQNAAMEPEIKTLADFLASNGADIKGAGTPTICIKGGLSDKLPKEFIVPPDRIEAGTFAILGALAAKKLKIANFPAEELSNLLWHFEKMKITYEIKNNSLIISKPKKILSVDLKTSPYPGFPTDLQSPFVVLLTQAFGESLVFETVFEGRLNYIFDLIKMGADITQCDPHRIIVNGPNPLFGGEFQSLDIRAGLALVLAGLIAKGRTIINNIELIDRGYERIEERLRKIGAKIKRAD